MAVEKTIEFLIGQPAAFEDRFGRFEAGLEALAKEHAATEKIISAFAKAGQAQSEMHHARLDGLEKRIET